MCNFPYSGLAAYDASLQDVNKTDEDKSELESLSITSGEGGDVSTSREFTDLTNVLKHYSNTNRA